MDSGKHGGTPGLPASVPCAPRRPPWEWPSSPGVDPNMMQLLKHTRLPQQSRCSAASHFAMLLLSRTGKMDQHCPRPCQITNLQLQTQPLRGRISNTKRHLNQ